MCLILVASVASAPWLLAAVAIVCLLTLDGRTLCMLYLRRRLHLSVRCVLWVLPPDLVWLGFGSPWALVAGSSCTFALSFRFILWFPCASVVCAIKPVLFSLSCWLLSGLASWLLCFGCYRFSYPLTTLLAFIS